MSILYKATTEGDCEGRSTRTLGIFQANSKLQVIEYLVANNIKPYYKYQVDEVEVKDIQDIEIKYVADIIEEQYGGIQVVLNAELAAELKRKQLISSSMGKLTKEEALAMSGYNTNFR